MKQVISILMIAALMLSLAACGAQTGVAGGYGAALGETAEKTTEEPTAAPESTAAPTAEPTEAPTEEPVITPDEWFIDEAWEMVQEICEVYPIDFLMYETHGIERWPEEDLVAVHFGTADITDPYIEIRFAPSEDGAWSISGCYAFINGDENYQKLWADRNAFGSWFNFEVSADELEETGYELTGDEEADVEAAARFVLDRMAERFVGLGEDDLMRCIGAKATEMSLYIFDPTEDQYHYDARIAARPAHYYCFYTGFGEASTGWLYLGEEHPELKYWCEINLQLQAERRSDGSFFVCVSIPFVEEEGD